MNQTLKAVIFWAVIVVSAFLLWQTAKSNSDSSTSEISYSRFLALVGDGQVSRVTIAGSVVRGYDTKGSGFRVIAPPNQYAMLDALQQHGVEIWFKDVPEGHWWNWLANLAPLILLAALWFFMIRQMQKAGRLRSGGHGTPQSASSPESQPRFGP